jgi:hypothetical protein
MDKYEIKGELKDKNDINPYILDMVKKNLDQL